MQRKNYFITNIKLDPVHTLQSCNAKSETKTFSLNKKVRCRIAHGKKKIGQTY